MSSERTQESDLAIEPLSRSNLPDLVSLFESVDNRYFAHASVASAEQFLAEPADVHVLGRAEGQVVAFGMLRGWHEGFAVPSLGIAVAREREGRGYGRAMMVALEELARQRRAKRIRLRVHPANARARRLYEQRGYRVNGSERGETVMILDL